MSTRVLYDPEVGAAVLYNSTTGIAFGEIFDASEDGTPADEIASEFVAYSEANGHDPSALHYASLANLRARWFAARAEADRAIEEKAR